MTLYHSMPTAEQRLLLLAALAQTSRGHTAWTQWLQLTKGRAADAGSRRLLPLVAWNLADVADEDLRVARMARRALALTALRRLEEAAQRTKWLGETGIDVIVLKGAALAFQYYPEPALRPMGDVDLLVHQADAMRACERLLAGGYRPLQPMSEARLPFIHGQNFVGNGLPEIDLHWRLFPERWHPTDAGRWWEQSIAFDFAGTPALMLSAADQLVHVFGHGLAWSPVPGIRWAADAAMVLSERGPAVDFDELVESARRQRMTQAVHDGLRLLHELELVAVPTQLLSDLESRPSITERLEHRLVQRRATFMVGGGLPLYLLRYIERVRRERRVPTPWGFARYIQHSWGEASALAVAQRMVKRANLRLRAWWNNEEPPPL